MPPGGGSSGLLTLDRGVGEAMYPLEMPALCPAAEYLDGMEKTGCSQALTRTRTPSPWP